MERCGVGMGVRDEEGREEMMDGGRDGEEGRKR